MDDLRKKLKLSIQNFETINEFLMAKNNPLVEKLVNLVERYGGVKEINKKAEEVRKIESLLGCLDKENSPFLRDLNWLQDKRDNEAFVNLEEYRNKILGDKAETFDFIHTNAVTLEISGSNFFTFFIEEAKKSIIEEELMPARYIRVRSMKEQVEDNDITAFLAATQIIGSTSVQTLENKGTLIGKDGNPINVHLGGAETITGYFGGIGVPNEYSLRWAEEFLHYYTEHGVREVLNVNPGTVTIGYILYKMGVDIQFKISVYMGNDNPYAVLWTLLGAKLFARDDGSTPLVGLNLSNSADNWTIKQSDYIRGMMRLHKIRLEHHITETYRSIVRQPYDRLDELVDIVPIVGNISAKHEGGICEIERKREHKSDILDYFIPKKEIIRNGLMPKLLQNYLDKHDAVNRTARKLTFKGLAVLPAWRLH